jgi:subfamily B ATP-binding cassette protein HlyB/CyaB
MAIEPQMQRRWEELARRLHAGEPGAEPGNTASQVVQLVSKIVTAGHPHFGAKLVGRRRPVGRRAVAFNILAGRVCTVLRLAQIWQDFHQARLSVLRLGDILNTTAEQTYAAGARGCQRSAAISGSTMSRSAIASTDRKSCTTSPSMCRPGRHRHRRALGSGKSTFAKLVQRLYAGERARPGRRHGPAMADLAWLRRQIGVVLQENVLFNRLCARISRSPTLPCRWSAPSRRVACGATNSSSS